MVDLSTTVQRMTEAATFKVDPRNQLWTVFVQYWRPSSLKLCARYRNVLRMYVTCVERERGKWPWQRGWGCPDAEALPVAAPTAEAQAEKDTVSTHPPICISHYNLYGNDCVPVCILSDWDWTGYRKMAEIKANHQHIIAAFAYSRQAACRLEK